MPFDGALAPLGKLHFPEDAETDTPEKCPGVFDNSQQEDGCPTFRGFRKVGTTESCDLTFAISTVEDRLDLTEERPDLTVEERPFRAA